MKSIAKKKLKKMSNKYEFEINEFFKLTSAAIIDVVNIFLVQFFDAEYNKWKNYKCFNERNINETILFLRTFCSI